MKGDDLLDMDYFLNEDGPFDDLFGEEGFYMDQKTALKNNLISLLEQTCPGANDFFDSASLEESKES